MAHPLRLALLDHLDKVPSATATECAAATSASVASCSYHLRVLARHGYIEQIEQPGREKPWRSSSRSRTHTVDQSLPGSQHAVAALSGVVVTREFERIMRWVELAGDLPPEDLEPASIRISTFYATPEEILELREQVSALLDRFNPRRSAPELRPEGSREVRFFGVTNLEPDHPRHTSPPPASDSRGRAEDPDRPRDATGGMTGRGTPS